MSEYYLTDPEDPKARSRLTAKSKYFDYKETVAFHLHQLGIPHGKAEIAVVDLRSDLVKAHRERISPGEVASSLVERVRRMYNIAPS